jgi:hypothetical protein
MTMSCTKSSINDDLPVNDMIRRAVRAEIDSGANWMGATAALAAHLDVSPRMIRARCREELVGPSRMKRDLVEGCWSFLDMIAKRQRAWVDQLAGDIERHRVRRQLTLPLEFGSGTPVAGSLPPKRNARAGVTPSAPANEALLAKAKTA